MYPRVTYDSTLDALRRGETTCEQVTRDLLRNVQDGKRLNAFLSVFNDLALERARAIDRKRADGTAGRLAGMVIAVKDVLSMRNEKVTCASRILEDYVAPYDATVIERLLAEDAVLIGKTNLDEFAMGSSTENSAFGPVLNPVDETRVPAWPIRRPGGAVRPAMNPTTGFFMYFFT